jgi:hypothetical protein
VVCTLAGIDEGLLAVGESLEKLGDKFFMNKLTVDIILTPLQA